MSGFSGSASSEKTEVNSEIVSNGFFHSVTKITIHRQDNSTDNLDINITNNISISRWQTVLIATGALFLGGVFIYIIYRLCRLSFSTLLGNRKGVRRRLTTQEQAVNQILSNSGARQVLSSLARTAINSQTRSRSRVLSSQMSMNSTGEALDISERVVRVSFAPSVRTFENSEEEKSIGCESVGPPAYDTLTSSLPAYPDSPPGYTELNTAVGHKAKLGTPQPGRRAADIVTARDGDEIPHGSETEEEKEQNSSSRLSKRF